MGIRDHNFTPERIQDGMIAELVFGWTWQERKASLKEDDLRFYKTLVPPLNDVLRFEPINYSPDIFRPAKDETPPFSDWTRVAQYDPLHTWQSTRHELPFFTTNAADDYLVLDRIRESFPEDFQDIFLTELLKIWTAGDNRYGGPAMRDLLRYKPGDYSKAALISYKILHPDHVAFSPKRVYIYDNRY